MDNINQESTPRNFTNEDIKTEINETVQQLYDENIYSLLGFARGLLKYQKLTGN